MGDDRVCFAFTGLWNDRTQLKLIFLAIGQQAYEWWGLLFSLILPVIFN